METNRKCIICATEFTYDHTDRNDLLYPDNNSCRTCQHWYDLWQLKDNEQVVRVDNHHYMISDEKVSNKRFKGFGGQVFKIQFDDGRVVETDNLWSQGEIPKHWQEFGLVSNARMAQA